MHHNKSDISYLKTRQAFKHSDPLEYSPGSYSQSVGGSVGITSSCSLLAFRSRSALCRHIYFASVLLVSTSNS